MNKKDDAAIKVKCDMTEIAEAEKCAERLAGLLKEGNALVDELASKKIREETVGKKKKYFFQQVCQCIAAIFGWELGKWLLKVYNMTFGGMASGRVTDKLICIGICIVVTVITNRILAIRTFKVIDGYVKDLFETTKESLRNAYLRE